MVGGEFAHIEAANRVTYQHIRPRDTPILQQRVEIVRSLLETQRPGGRLAPGATVAVIGADLLHGSDLVLYPPPVRRDPPRQSLQNHGWPAGLTLAGAVDVQSIATHVDQLSRWRICDLVTAG